MKNLIVIISLFCFVPVFAQNANDELKNINSLQLPISPANVLLDGAPTSINSSNNPQAISLTVLNSLLTQNNFSIQVTPFWFAKHSNYSDLRYYGYVKDTSKLKYNPLSQIRQVSFSIAYVTNQASVTYIDQYSVGASTRLLQFKTNGQKDEYLTYRRSVFKYCQDFATKVGMGMASIDDFKNVSNFKNADQPSIFSVDISGAFSIGGQRQDFFNHNQAGRAGAWASFGSEGTINKDKNVTIKAVVLGRWLYSNPSSIFQTTYTNNADVGVKGRFTYGKGSFSLEYLRRFDLDHSGDYMERCNGVITYAFNEALAIVGTFGQNFKDGSGLSLLGINWNIKSGN